MARLTVSWEAGILPSVAGDPDIGRETVGRRLRRLRLARGVSQRELSEPGVTYAYISRIEAGTRQPSVKALRVLARKLGVSPEYLETGSELPADARRELRLAEQELRLRLAGETDELEVQAILEEAEQASDRAAAVRAGVLLGFSASARGDQAGAIAQLSPLLGSELVTPSSRPDVYATLGHAYALAGSPERAVALFEDALAELSRLEPENRAAEVRYASYLSYALTDLGELPRARSVVSDLWARSTGAEDRYARIRLHWSAARVALEEGRPLLALDQFRRAIVLLQATEDDLQLARAHIACADAALSAGGSPASARDHLAEAEALLGSQAPPADLGVLRRIQALEALERGEPARALELAEGALELSDTLPGEQGRAWWALARARALAGEQGADQAFAEAAELLARDGLARESLAVLRSFGRWLRDQGRDQEALEVLERAAELAAAPDGLRSGEAERPRTAGPTG